MITTRALLVLAASLIVCLEVQAQTCPINTTVYFGNGVNTSLEDTQRNARIIGRFLMNQVPASDRCRYEFKAAYNPSVNLWVDLVEAARQTLGNEYPTLLLAFILHKIGVPPVFTNLLPPGALLSLA